MNDDNNVKNRRDLLALFLPVLLLLYIFTGCSNPEIRLTSSRQNLVFKSINPLFSWNLPKKQYFYTIRVSSDESFSDILSEKTVFDTNSLRLDKPLVLGELFVQLGISSSQGGKIKWIQTSPIKIHISPPVCDKRELKAYYLDEAVVKWSPNPDAVRYEIQVSTDNQFIDNSILHTIKTVNDTYSVTMKYPNLDNLYCRVRTELPGEQYTEWSDIVKIEQIFFGLAALNIPETSRNILTVLSSTGKIQFGQKFPGRQTLQASNTNIFLGLSSDYHTFLLHQFQKNGVLDWQMEIPFPAELKPFSSSTVLRGFSRYGDGSFGIALTAQDRIYLARFDNNGEYLNTRLITIVDIQKALIEKDPPNEDIVRIYEINDIIFAIDSNEVLLAGNICLNTYNSNAFILSVSSQDFEIKNLNIYHDKKNFWTYDSIIAGDSTGENIEVYGHEIESGGEYLSENFFIIKHVYNNNRKQITESSTIEIVSASHEKIKFLDWEGNTLAVYRDKILYIPNGFDNDEKKAPASLCKAFDGDIIYHGIIRDRYLFGGFISPTGNRAWITGLFLSETTQNPYLFRGSVYPGQNPAFPFFILDNLDTPHFFGVWDDQMMSGYSISGSDIRGYGVYSKKEGIINKIGKGLFKCQFPESTETWEIIQFARYQWMTVKVTKENNDEYIITLYRDGEIIDEGMDGP